MKREYLECGKIINTHGVRGAVKVESYCDTPAVLAGLPRVFLAAGKDYLPYRVTYGRVHGAFVLLGLEGISTPEAAAVLKNKLLYAHRDDVPRREGAVFWADMIGLPVLDADDGHLYGHIRAVEESPASVLYAVATDKGEVLLPAVPEFIKEIDAERGVFIRPISGFFDED